jgi:hypothetical protein
MNFYDDFGGWPMVFFITAVALGIDAFGFWIGWFPLK